MENISFLFDDNNIFYPDKIIQRTFTYSGKAEKIILYPGRYRFDLYGANGGFSHGGNGGHVSATFVANQVTELFLYVGEAGKSGSGGTPGNGGWNGGGNGGNPHPGFKSGGGGGGATDIRSVSGNWNENFEKRIMVAGGGGGGSGYGNLHGGDGGGIDGSDSFTTGSDASCPSFGSIGGKRSSGHSFGTGQNGKGGRDEKCSAEGGGGGGGGWFGGNANTGDTRTFGGGGGSGYISPTLLNPVFEEDKNTRTDLNGNGYIVLKNDGPLPTKACRPIRHSIVLGLLLFVYGELE